LSVLHFDNDSIATRSHRNETWKSTVVSKYCSLPGFKVQQFMETHPSGVKCVEG